MHCFPRAHALVLSPIPLLQQQGSAACHKNLIIRAKSKRGDILLVILLEAVEPSPRPQVDDVEPGAAGAEHGGTVAADLHAAAGVEGLHPPGHGVVALEAQGPGRRHAAGLPRAARRKASLPARGGDVMRAKEAGSAMAATGGAAPPDRAASKRPTRPRNVPGVLPPPPREPPGLFGLRKVQIRGLQYELEQLNLY